MNVLIKGRRTAINGIRFGMLYWIVTLPAMFITYGTFPLTFTMVLSWIMTGLIQSICAGWIISVLVKEKKHETVFEKNPELKNTSILTPSH